MPCQVQYRRGEFDGCFVWNFTAENEAALSVTKLKWAQPTSQHRMCNPTAKLIKSKSLGCCWKLCCTNTFAVLLRSSQVFWGAYLNHDVIENLKMEKSFSPITQTACLIVSWKAPSVLVVSGGRKSITMVFVAYLKSSGVWDSCGAHLLLEGF